MISQKIKELLESTTELSKALKASTQIIHQNLEFYDWVGFYFMNHKDQTLHLGPYTGATTDHTVIPFGKGICGQVATTGNSYIAADVNQESNYIACSIDVKSEIVVPMYFKGKLIGQIDIDSHKTKAFSAEDEYLLSEVCKLITSKFGTELEIYAQQLFNTN